MPPRSPQVGRIIEVSPQRDTKGFFNPTCSTGFGGKGANQAVAAARLLRQTPDAPPDDRVLVAMHGSVGDDQFGKDFLTHLKDGEKMDVANVNVKTGFKTGTSAILVEEGSGENRILFTKGANGDFTADDAAKLRPVKEGEMHFVVLQLEIPMDSVRLPCEFEGNCMLTATDDCMREGCQSYWQAGGPQSGACSDAPG